MSDDNGVSKRTSNRRDILKVVGTTVGATSLYSGLSPSVLAAQSDTTSDSDIEVVDATLESGAAVSTVSSESSLHPKAQHLVGFIEQDSGLTGVTDVNLSIDVKTNDKEFNSHDPAIDIIPFGGNKQKAKKRGRDPQQGGGLLFIYTVIEDGERIPVGTFGMTSGPLGGRGTNSATEGGKRRLTSYILNDGQPERAKTEVVGKSQVDSDGISTQISVICASCQTLVDAVCAGSSRVLGQYGCVAACSAAFGANFIAIFGCANICSTMFTAIAAVGCTAAGSVICKEMTDRTPGYITFC